MVPLTGCITVSLIIARALICSFTLRKYSLVLDGHGLLDTGVTMSRVHHLKVRLTIGEESLTSFQYGIREQPINIHHKSIHEGSNKNNFFLVLSSIFFIAWQFAVVVPKCEEGTLIQLQSLMSFDEVQGTPCELCEVFFPGILCNGRGNACSFP